MSSPPTKYTRGYDFVAFQTGNPATPLPAIQVHNELAALKTTTDTTIDRLAEIQRDDGKLANQTVGVDQLDPSAIAILTGTTNPRGAWATATEYARLDLVTVSGAVYVATVAHTSDAAFSVDLAADRWMLFANPLAADNAAFFQQFSGNGSQTLFTLSASQGNDPRNIFVFVNGAPRRPTIDYTLAGAALTFTAAPGSGTNNVLVFGAANAVASSVADAANSANAAAASAAAALVSEGAASTAAGTATAQAGIATAAANTATAAAANLPNAPAAGANNFIRANATADGWVYLNAAALLAEIGAEDAALNHAYLDVVQAFTRAQRYAPATLTDAASIDWNLDTAPLARVTLAGNRTINAPTNQRDGGTYIVVVNQDGTGSRTLAWNAAFDFGVEGTPVLPTGASKVAIFTFLSNGTSMRCIGRWNN